MAEGSPWGRLLILGVHVVLMHTCVTCERGTRADGTGWGVGGNTAVPQPYVNLGQMMLALSEDVRSQVKAEWTKLDSLLADALQAKSISAANDGALAMQASQQMLMTSRQLDLVPPLSPRLLPHVLMPAATRQEAGALLDESVRLSESSRAAMRHACACLHQLLAACFPL